MPVWKPNSVLMYMQLMVVVNVVKATGGKSSLNFVAIGQPPFLPDINRVPPAPDFFPSSFLPSVDLLYSFPHMKASFPVDICTYLRKLY